ncbi:unnamed protein product [Bubo scandiacus]
MCTTLLLLGTLVMMLRRRFFNKVEPYVLSRPLPVPLGPWGCRWEREGCHLMSQLSQGREKQDWKQGRHLPACVPWALPVLPVAAAKLKTH